MGFLKKVFKPVKKIVGAIFKPIGRLLKKWLMPKVPGKEGLVIQRKGSDVFIPVVYGTREVGAIVVDNNVTDAPGGAENELFHVLAVFCYGEIDGFTEFFFNGISENDQRWRKDKNNPNSAKWFTKETRTGTVNQTAVNAVGKLNRFNTTTSRYEGLALAFFTFEQDKDQSVWNGEPEITAIIRGKKCFDPRTNLTQYTENPSLHLLDYIKSPIYGKGLTDGEINISAFIALANICDINETAIVDTQVCQTVNGVYTCTGSPAEPVTFRRFSNNTIIDTERQIFENMEEIAESYRGFFPDNNGLISVACEKEETPVFHFDSENILSNITSSKPGRNERYNRVIVRFPNIANKYEVDEVCFPDVDDPLYEQWLEEDNFLPQELVLTAHYCVYKALALQLAEVAAKVSRNSETVNFTASPLAMECDVGDVVTLTEEIRGWVNRTFRISDIGYRDDGFVDITGIQHEDGVYPWSNVAYSEIVGGSNLGDPTNIPAPTALTITPDPTFSTSGTLTWQSANNAFIRRYEVTVFQGSTLVYRTETLGKLWSIPLFDANVYSISVRAVSTLGTLSPAASIAFELTQPQAPTDINFTISNFEIEARPVLLGFGLGTSFEFDCVEGDGAGHTPTSKARGATATFVGLKHNTLYTVFARTINALGNSDWINSSISTTADAGPIIDLIGDTYFEQAIDPIVNDLQEQLDDARNAIVDLGNDNKMRIQRIEYDLNSTQKQLLQTTDYARQIQQQASDLTNALFFVDPENGTITNLAFSYTDNQFTQAALLIDGVNAEVSIQAQRVTSVENRITNAESEIEVQAGQIALRATYTDVNEIVAGAIDAILPAYSFGFFAGADGWSAVNGTLTPQPSRVLLTWGDIQNQALSYVADENPIISISFERTGGTGWTGDVIVTFDDNSTQTYGGVIEDIPEGGGFVRNLNLGNETTYTGTVTELRLVLGASVADTFTVTQITIGKPSAALLELEGITAQVNQLGIEINAVNASLVNYVTTAFYDANTVTLNNVETVLDGTEAIISLKATQTFINEQGTVDKANAAAIWVDAAEANITSAVQVYNAQPGGINDQFDAIDGEFTVVQQTLDAQTGSISNSIVAISKLDESAKKDGLNLLLAEYSLYLRKKGELELGVGVATAKSDISAVSNSVQAVAQSVLELDASFGTAMGQIDANFNQTNQTIANETLARTTAITDLTVSFNGQLAAQSQLIQDVKTDVEGNSNAIASLNTRANNLEDFTEAQLILNSEYDAELNTLVSRAFLGVENTVGGVATIAGITIDDADYALRFQGDIFSLADTAGNQRLYWDSVNNTWIFNGRLVVGGYTVNSEADIRALDGKTFETRYSTSSATPTGSNPSGWTITPPNTTSPIYASNVTRLSNGNIEGTWSTPVRWNGLQGAAGANGSNGNPGAGFYGSTYDAISWTTATANSRFQSLVGRAPVNFDIFTQTRTDGTDSQARQYNGGSWEAVALQVNGSIVASGTIAADKVTATFLQSVFISTGGLDVTEGNNRVRIRPNNITPILFEVDGQETFSVNIDGTGFFAGKLAENTVGALAITDEAKKAVNPYYLGGGEKYGTSGTAVRMGSGATVDIGTFTSLQAGDRVAISFRFQEAVEWVEGISGGSMPSYTNSSYTITLQRRIGSTGSFINVTDAINLTITPYSYGGFTPPGEPYEPRVTGYSYDVNQQFTNVLPSTSNHVTYRLVVTRTSGSGTTAQGLLRRQFIGEKATYKLNEIRGTAVKQWIDKETGFTIISGSVTRVGYGSDYVSFPTALAEVYSCTLGYNRNTEAGGNRYPPRYRNLSTTGVTIDSIDSNTQSANVTSYQVTGRVAVS